MQILRYDHGQKYDQHYDSSNEQPPELVAAVLPLYWCILISNVEKGGETAFPKAQVKRLACNPKNFHALKSS